MFIDKTAPKFTVCDFAAVLSRGGGLIPESTETPVSIFWHTDSIRAILNNSLYIVFSL